MRMSIRGMAAAAAATLLNASVAFAAPPTIATITFTYTAGAPTSVTITGSGLCGSSCTKPTVTLSGTSLSVGTYSSTSVAATLPSGIADGEYSLVLTAGSSGSANQVTVLKSVAVGPTTTGAPGTAASVSIGGTA